MKNAGIAALVMIVGCADSTSLDSFTLPVSTLSGPTCEAGAQLICHVPPGNPANEHDICVGPPAVQAHLDRHGDRLGSCGGTTCTPAGAACATDGECCNGNLCTDSLCQPACGRQGMACCLNSHCQPGGCCVQGQCAEPGNSCGIAPPGDGACINGSCANGTCGGLGQRVCSGDLCTAAQTLPQGSTCIACGGAGQPCCAGSTCAVGAVCSGTICAQCGSPGQPCCAGSPCSDGTCNGGTCAPSPL